MEIVIIGVVGVVLGLGVVLVTRLVRAGWRAGAPNGPGTIACEDCRRPVSKRARSCPNCGAPVEADAA